jgi:hypothetical protein
MLFVAKILWGTKVKIFCRPSVKLSWYEVCIFDPRIVPALWKGHASQ